MNEPEKPDANEPQLLDHEYDGIREYDNPLPRWWVGMFWATIVFAALYLMNVIPGLGAGRGWIANYEREMSAAQARAAAAEAEHPTHEMTEDVVFGFEHDAAALAEGKTTFTTTCAACHRPDGGGNIGPNLTDDFWLHGDRPAELVHTITNGYPDKGMPAWGPALTPEQVGHVAAYILTLHGMHPREPKAPQGERLDVAVPAGGASKQ
jgi:cytochrome c oxidase cbb3-type subunit 3